MRYSHLLFDFFGTLVDYSASRTEQGFQLTHAILVDAGGSLAYADFLRRWDAHFEAFERHCSDHLEYSMDALCTSFLREQTGRSLPADIVQSFRDAYLQEWSVGVRDIAGVADLLSELAQRYCLALVTNTHHADLVRGHLRRMQIERHFRAVVTSVEHGRRKPSPCIFARALELCGGAAASRALYVGDSYAADYRGAKAAGLDCLLIDPRRQHDVPQAHRLDGILQLRQSLLHA